MPRSYYREFPLALLFFGLVELQLTAELKIAIQLDQRRVVPEEIGGNRSAACEVGLLNKMIGRENHWDLFKVKWSNLHNYWFQIFVTETIIRPTAYNCTFYNNLQHLRVP